MFWLKLTIIFFIAHVGDASESRNFDQTQAMHDFSKPLSSH